MTADRQVVSIERTFRAPIERVFDAWVTPEVLRRWFRCGAGWTTPIAEVDLRIGGEIRVVMSKPDGSPAGARGTFTLIDRPHRLEMTWTFDDDPSNEQVVELTFTSTDEGTTVLLTNSGIWGRGRRENQDWGWRECLNTLELVMAG